MTPLHIKRSDISKGLGSKEWAKYIGWMGGTVLPDATCYPPDEHTILTTNCSAEKSDIVRGYPVDLYLGKGIKRLHDFCLPRKQEYAILSDLYGIVFKHEHVDNYDVSPSSIPDARLWDCGEIINVKCDQRSYRYIHFVASSPVMACPYFIMLAASGLPFAYSTKLRGRIK